MLHLYRRHVLPCRYRSQRFHNCKCPIYVRGSLGGEWVKRSLNEYSWDAATETIGKWIASGHIGVVRQEIPALAGAVDEFLADMRTNHRSPETLRKYEHLLKKRLVPWAEKRGRTNLQSLDVSTLGKFRAEFGSDSAIYSLKNLERLRAFFRFCVKSKWLKDNPATELTRPKVEGGPVLPFSEEDFQKILAATEKYRGNKKRIRAFILTMRYSGLRISDTISLRRDALRDGKIWVRTEKTGTQVWVPVPPVVVEALNELPQAGERFFWNGRGKLTTRVANWSRYLSSVFVLADISGAHSHRFRHLFATSLLQRGTSVENVATLLGNSNRIVEKHYSAWIKERQAILEREVAATW